MKSLSCIFLSLLFVFACQADQKNPAELKPEKVYRIVYEYESNEWYQQQAQLWQKEIEQNPQNEEAWYNYYNANRYAHFEDIDQVDKKNKLAKIIDDMNQAIPETYTSYLLTYWNSYNIKDLTLVEKAYKLQPDRPDTYYPFISKAVAEGDKQSFNSFCTKLYNSKDIAQWLVNYNYNVLMSAEQNAVIFTNGDNDTYPIWMLQSAKKIRPDVTIINVSLLPEEDYFSTHVEHLGLAISYKDVKARAAALPASNFRINFLHNFVNELIGADSRIPVYFALTVYQKYFEPFEDDLYIVGLAYRYSKKRIDNLAILKKNLERHFRTDYLLFDWYKENQTGKKLMATMNLNYIAPIIMLAEHYNKAGDKEQAQKWKKIALKIALDSGREKIIEEIQNLNF